MDHFSQRRIYTMSVQVITPLHIGTGQELMRDIDYAVHNGQTYRLDVDRIMEDFLIDEGGQLRTRQMESPPGQLLQAADFANPAYFRYAIKGEPRATATGSKIKECIKTHDDRAYIPGSSIKGALRTALAWAGWEQVTRKGALDKSRFKPSRNWAGNSLEQDIFGRGPNYDLLRALIVNDAFGPAPGEGLQLSNVAVHTRGGPQAPIEIETVAVNTRFSGRLVLDLDLADKFYSRAFPAHTPWDWLRQLSQRVNAHTRQQLADLSRSLDHPAFGERPREMVQKLEELMQNEAEGRMILQLGFGGGWDSKTFGIRLHQENAIMSWVVQNYRLYKGKSAYKPGAPFPSSRRLTVTRRRHAQTGEIVSAPGLPLGWVLVKLGEKAEA
ncbi:MAG: type III-A CRISPR-associated RAMP protein Csm5 [Chloroflexi bacterium]|nr:type III-A CRISPR-associated RAMP protein Csm5 [Chloroflexota bacterium]